MSQNCRTEEKNGQELVDFIRGKGKEEIVLSVQHTIQCSCGKPFKMVTAVSQCPSCYMTYGVTPCSANDPTKIKAASIKY